MGDPAEAEEPFQPLLFFADKETGVQRSGIESQAFLAGQLGMASVCLHFREMSIMFVP